MELEQQVTAKIGDLNDIKKSNGILVLYSFKGKIITRVREITTKQTPQNCVCVVGLNGYFDVKGLNFS